MAFRNLVLVATGCLALLGCRRNAHDDVYLDLLNAEKRALEDRVYELEYDYQKAMRQLAACRAERQEKPQPKRPSRQSDPSSTADPEPDYVPDIQLPPGADGFPDFSIPGDSDLEPPIIDPGIPLDKPPESAARPGATGPAGGQTADDMPSVGDAVASIHLNPRLTGGNDFDGTPGDDGLSVLVEPRGPDGQFVGRPAAVSVVLLDPAKQGAAARVARWDFDREVAAKSLRTSSVDRGLHFQMPWPERPPENRRLHLFVRYLTSDGRKLEADREITVDPPSAHDNAWASRPEREPAEKAAGKFAERSVVTRPAKSAAAKTRPAVEPASQPRAAATGRFWQPYR